MKRSIVNEFEKLSDKLWNYNAVFSFQLKNLCVKADPVSLLDMKVLIDGEFQELEKCTTIGQKDEFTFAIAPHYREDMPALMRAIFKAHPEFKQEISKMTVKTKDLKGNSKDQEVPYVLVTMPEVNDDRYDLLNDGVNLCYDKCKALMDAAVAKSEAKFAELLIGEGDDARDELKDSIDLLKDEWFKKRDQTRDEKLQEIEDAYKKWLKKVGE